MAAGLNPQRMLHRMSFGLKVRTEVWQTLADFTLTGMEISMAFETAARIYRLQGNRSVEHILLEFRNAMVTGSIAETAAAYATESDRLMFTGESDIEAHRMFAAAARVGKAQLVIRQAVRSALFGPCLSLLGLIALYIVLGTRLFPAFEQAAPAAAWPTHVQILAWLSYGVAENIAVLAAGAACLAAAVTASVRMWTGLGRSWADRIPPWSLYRMQTGLTFMLLLVESGKMGRSLTTSWMLDVARASGPYTASRIRAIARLCGADPSGIGSAALRTGQGWPTAALNATLAAYSTQPDWLSNYSDYLDRWLLDAEARAKAAAAMINYLMLGVIAATIAVTVVTMFSLMEAAQAGY